MHYFITGHTGFKGAWLIGMLKTLGHEVSGYSLEVESSALFQTAELRGDLHHHFDGDVRDLDSLKRAISKTRPDVAVHFAAQSLVLRSYEDPIETYTTNVLGTLNFLEAISSLTDPPIVLVVTTDKVYKDTGEGNYTEEHPLGGYDPYSASKAMADILTQSWAETNPHLRLAVARAGNVIGAYDTARNRLIPDILTAVSAGVPLQVRNQSAVRPWQHVLDCLNGYLMLTDALFRGERVPTALNFGPDPGLMRSVSDVIEVARSMYPSLKIDLLTQPGPRETANLTLNSSKAEELLGWSSSIGFEDAVSRSLRLRKQNPRCEFFGEVEDFLSAKTT